MPLARPLTKEKVLEALNNTKSIKQAARYVGLSYPHFRRWCKLYKDKETGKTLLEKYKNRGGKGIPKFYGGSDEGVYILDIIEGRVDASYFTPARIKQRLILEGYMEEKCKRCGFDEARVIDNKVPLLFVFEDGNKKNYSLKNLCLICYNCYFLTIGNIFSNKEIDSIEDYSVPNKKEVTWELDDYHLETLKKLGLTNEEEKSDPQKYIDNI